MHTLTLMVILSPKENMDLPCNNLYTSYIIFVDDENHFVKVSSFAANLKKPSELLEMRTRQDQGPAPPGDIFS